YSEIVRRTRSPRPPLFPYPTLFRSVRGREVEDDAMAGAGSCRAHAGQSQPVCQQQVVHCALHCLLASYPWGVLAGAVAEEGAARSEEHTSELQSRENLVCRLLLEKK